MGSSSRTSRPAPLDTTSPNSQAMSSPTAYDSAPRSAGTVSSAASFSPSTHNRRTNSTTSAGSSAASTASYHITGDNSRKVPTGAVNANSYCGRHSDQFLFGGWGDIVKGVFHPRKR